ncbi:MAG TPA: hypothetical protein VKA43_01100 [Gammaproteobacteria bacterium]|nr:hypothetical protein [Gammaproteobacteria bacterium]
MQGGDEVGVTQHAHTFLDVAAADEHWVDVFEHRASVSSLRRPLSLGQNTRSAPVVVSSTQSASPKPRSSPLAAPM